MAADLTKTEVLYFLNEIEFCDELDKKQLEKIKRVRETIVKDFEDISLSRMLHTLKILEDIEMSFVTNSENIDYRAERIQSLRSNFFYLVSFKQLFDIKKIEKEQ